MEPLERSIVRVFSSSSRTVVGSGFLISKSHVLTCAHVVHEALGDQSKQNSGGALVSLQFPFISQTMTYTAKIIRESSVTEDGGEDLAVLEIQQELPKDMYPVRMIDVDKGYQQEFKAYGFPEGYPNGVWTSGLLRGKVATGRVQVEDIRHTGYFIEPGFSGTPVWNEGFGGVLGMVVSADAERSARVAFMIPTVRVRAILGATIPEFQSVYHPPIQKKETLLTNLLTVQYVSPRLYIATATTKSVKHVFDQLREKGVSCNEWLLKGGYITSFENLEEPQWAGVCDQGSIEVFDTDEWAYSTDEDRQRDFVFLLNTCMKSRVREDLQYDKGGDYFYFRATEDLKSRIYPYHTGKQKTERQVFAPYEQKTGENAGMIYYYRHSAFTGHFRRYDDIWYLEITPTYHFTSNGKDQHPSYEDFIKKIKQLERNQAVMGQVRMWAYYLTPQPNFLTPEYPHLKFGHLVTLDASFGLNDEEWLSHEEDKRIIEQPVEDTPLFEGL